MSVHVVALLKVKEGDANAIAAQIKELATKTRQEPGVIQYDIYEDAKEPGSFVFLEEYKSQADFESHQQTAHLKEAIEKIKPNLIAPADIKTLKRMF